jgi:cation diffusion facilitator family transporter
VTTDTDTSSPLRSAPSTSKAVYRATRSTLVGLVINALLALTKGVAGVLGNSYALIADAIESGTDIIASLIVLFGLRLAGKPADENHPYGHGKFEPLAAVGVSLMLLVAAVIICVESVKEITTPHHAPAPFTLGVLLGVILIKELLFRFVITVGDATKSTAVRSDAWHHRSDAITSLAAFVGISIALFGGPGYESADDFAALLAAFIIALNAVHLLRPALLELTDQAPDATIATEVRRIATTVPGVLGTHKCHVRKLGFDHYVDLDILCDPEATIRFGHTVAHDVGDAIHREMPYITRILVHVEPVDDFGKRNRSYH